ncbi:MAG: MotA/TolQ/ExbB proton channel family protein [Chlamydiales bacterium]|nr:MotA/TolQ/ExbB proton channel family protein [Chlamydiales bacterium]NCF71708.1 MotA/TolQ/ExbB proton channel family protein [Chlamydiales bacterium]
MDFNNITTSLLDYLSNWNTVMVIIIACSMLSVTIFIERLFFLFKSSSNTDQLMLKIRQVIKDQGVFEAIKVCEETGGSVAHILRTGLSKYDRPKEQIESAMEVTATSEIALLEKNTKILSMIGHIAPLIGLLGTVLGFIQAFSEMRTTGLMDISTTRIGEAMEYALITTAAGLTVAIPTVVAYNYIVSRIESFVLDMQVTSSEIIDILVNRQVEHYEA